MRIKEKPTSQKPKVNFVYCDFSYERFQGLQTKVPAIFTGNFVKEVFQVSPTGEAFCAYPLHELCRFANNLKHEGDKLIKKSEGDNLVKKSEDD
jgi:hypothetical protein